MKDIWDISIQNREREKRQREEKAKRDGPAVTSTGCFFISIPAIDVDLRKMVGNKIYFDKEEASKDCKALNDVVDEPYAFKVFPASIKTKQ